MVSCLPDKRAPGGAPFLVRCLVAEYIYRGVKAVAESCLAAMHPGTVEKGKAGRFRGGLSPL